MVTMKEVNSPEAVKEALGVAYPTGKRQGKFPLQRHVGVKGGELTKGKMDSLVSGSALTTEQNYSERVDGKEYKEEVERNPKFYQNEP